MWLLPVMTDPDCESLRRRVTLIVEKLGQAVGFFRRRGLGRVSVSFRAVWPIAEALHVADERLWIENREQGNAKESTLAGHVLPTLGFVESEA